MSNASPDEIRQAYARYIEMRDRVIAGWKNRLPGTRPHGGPYEATGVSILVCAGNGKFSYEEDLLNIVHVIELIQESGWKPSGEMNAPPAAPKS